MDSLLRQLQAANPDMEIDTLDSDAFAIYGRLLQGFDAEEMIARARAILPESKGVAYEPSVAALEEPSALNSRIVRQVYGGMPTQVGWCYGHNVRMGGLEYHKGSEVLVCITDVLLLVGHIDDVWFGEADDDPIRYDADNVEAFVAPAGAVVELHPWCLHFAPVQVRAGEPFATLVYLPRGTNEPLPYAPEPIGEARLLSAVNKWLIVHQDAAGLVDAGAYVGIEGEDLVVRPIVR